MQYCYNYHLSKYLSLIPEKILFYYCYYYLFIEALIFLTQDKMQELSLLTLTLFQCPSSTMIGSFELDVQFWYRIRYPTLQFYRHPRRIIRDPPIKPRYSPIRTIHQLFLYATLHRPGLVPNATMNPTKAVPQST